MAGYYHLNSTKALLSAALVLLMICGTLSQTQPVLETYSIPEESPAHTFVGDLSVLPDISALDADVVARMQYRLLRQGNDLAAYFSVQENDGVVETAEILDRDAICRGQSTCRVDLGIMASSPPDFYRHLTIGVSIMDINDNIPEFQTPRIERVIPESTAIGSSFSIPTARDPDSPQYGIGDYRLISGISDFRLKMVNASDSISLYLVLQTQVDREAQEGYRCVVAAVDKMDPVKSGTLTVDISIADINDHAPEFEAQTYTASVLENAEMDTVVTTVRAVDLDSGLNAEIVYGFSTQTDQEVLQVFEIDSSTGDILVSGTLDYEQKNVYNLVVTASDQSEQWLPSEAQVTITVDDVNDHRPQATISNINGVSNITVPENARPGTFLAYIMVQDMDSGSNGQVDCYMGEESFSLHQESQTAYSLHTAVALDRESVAEYSLSFLCRDRGSQPLSSTTAIAVSIEDINDNSPQFTQTQYTAVLAENNAIGAFVTKTFANDPDFGPNGLVTFSLDDTSKVWLDIDSSTGVITAKQAFDYEQFHNFSAQVTAFDHGDVPRSSVVTLVIHLMDINDQPPEFLQELYSLQVEENLDGEAEVGQVFARDRDMDPYNTFSFSLRSPAGVFNPFVIDSDTGVIFTNAILDREFKDMYSMVVIATDNNEPSLSSSASVRVSISDVNDNAPQITFPSSANDTIHISNLSPVGFALPKIQATDPDNGLNGTLVFSIVSGNEKEYFGLDKDSGVMSVRRRLSHIAMETFSLYILVKDSGTNPRDAEAIFTIAVNRSVELPPGTINTSTENPDDDDDDDDLVSDSNLAIVIAVVVVSMAVIIILLVAIVILRRQEQRRKQQKNMSRLLFDQRVVVSRDGEKEEPDGSMYCKSNANGNSSPHGYSNELEISDEHVQQLREQKQVRTLILCMLMMHFCGKYCMFAAFSKSILNTL